MTCKFTKIKETREEERRFESNKSLQISGLVAGLSPCQGFNPVESMFKSGKGFNPCCIRDFFLFDYRSLFFFHPLEHKIYSTAVCRCQASSQQNDLIKSVQYVQKFHLT